MYVIESERTPLLLLKLMHIDSCGLSSSHSLHPGDPSVQVQLWSDATSEEARYTFTIIDIHKSRAKNGPFAIFIVPQGR